MASDTNAVAAITQQTTPNDQYRPRHQPHATTGGFQLQTQAAPPHSATRARHHSTAHQYDRDFSSRHPKPYTIQSREGNLPRITANDNKNDTNRMPTAGLRSSPRPAAAWSRHQNNTHVIDTGTSTVNATRTQATHQPRHARRVSSLHLSTQLLCRLPPTP